MEERQERCQVRVVRDCCQDAVPGNMIVGADPVDTKNREPGVEFGAGAQHTGQSFGARLGAERVLVREARGFKHGGVLLGQSPGDEAPEGISHDQAADAAIPFLQGNKPAKAQRCCDGGREVG